MSRNRVILVTVGIMLSLFLASMESTVVATAMPTIVGQLGGLKNYSWVFSAFMLASTTTVPLYGKLSDIYGRRKLYVFAMALFLLGSLFCGLSTNLTHLILARALQGIGAGGIMPLAFILIGEMFSLEQRTKMQGVFSGVWGVSSVAGPLLGGFIVDQLSWHWIFYINLIPGLIAGALVALAWQDQVYSHERPAVDYAGAALLSIGVVLLLLGLMELGTSISWVFIVSASVIFLLLVWVERRAADPILPIALFRDKLFSTASSHGFFTGWAVFGTIAFIPLFVQAVFGVSPTQAGITVTPMLLGWVSASIFSTRILLKVGYRRLSLIGTSIFIVGATLLAILGADSSRPLVMAFVTLMGIGMGSSIPAFVIAVQTTVERRHLGVATSMLQFSRSMGGTLGVSVMGAALSMRLASNLNASGLDLGLVSQLLDPAPGSEVIVEAGARAAMANAIHLVFVIAFVAAVLGLLSAIFTPHKELTDKIESEPLPISAD
ncbi:MAG: MDR family MFS transporter [Anaerolineales bacterium]|nr:MAG: MDR family MFS transporter [Anaerolineales bacterium]